QHRALGLQQVQKRLLPQPHIEMKGSSVAVNFPRHQAEFDDHGDKVRVRPPDQGVQFGFAITAGKRLSQIIQSHQTMASIAEIDDPGKTGNQGAARRIGHDMKNAQRATQRQVDPIIENSGWLPGHVLDPSAWHPDTRALYTDSLSEERSFRLERTWEGGTTAPPDFGNGNPKYEERSTKSEIDPCLFRPSHFALRTLSSFCQSAELHSSILRLASPPVNHYTAIFGVARAAPSHRNDAC